MSIVDAIGKAKQLAQRSRGEQVAAPAPLIHTTIAESTRIDENPIAVPREPIKGKPVVIDPVACSRNRILVPGAAPWLEAQVESSFKMLRTRVLQRARTNSWTTIGITSACKDDGKTLTALNLALSLAREKSVEVVLLDLDLRNPSVCKRLNVDASTEVREYFEGDVAAENLFLTIGMENIFIAGSVMPSNHSSELLSTSKFEELIGYIKSATRQPVIIIDLPPVLSTDDTLVLAPRLDAILVVCSAGKTNRDELQRATDVLADFRVVGFVLNRSQEALRGYYGVG